VTNAHQAEQQKKELAAVRDAKLQEFRDQAQPEFKAACNEEKEKLRELEVRHADELASMKVRHREEMESREDKRKARLGHLQVAAIVVQEKLMKEFEEGVSKVDDELRTQKERLEKSRQAQDAEFLDLVTSWTRPTPERIPSAAKSKSGIIDHLNPKVPS